MKKFSAFLLMLSFVCMFCTACSTQTKSNNMIKSKRRFAQYVETGNKNGGSTVDLSEGPKLKYDGHLGPQNLNFDIKIVDPY